MKHILPVVVGTLLLLPALVDAQRLAAGYLELLSTPPQACGNEAEPRRAYLEKVSAISQQIATDLRARRGDSRAAAQRAREAEVRRAGKAAGLTDAQIEKAASGRRLTKEERDKLADQLLKQQFGISLAEAAPGRKRTKEEQDKLADQLLRQYGTSLAEASAAKETKSAEDSQQFAQKLAEVAGAKANAQGGPAGPAEAPNLVALAKERDTLARKIAFPGGRALEDIRKLEQDPELKQMQQMLDRLSAESRACSGPDCAVSEQKVKDARRAYCGRFSPRFHIILRQWLSDLTKAMPDFATFDNVEAQLEKAQMRVGKPIAAPGTAALSAVHEVAVMLKTSAFKYDPR